MTAFLLVARSDGSIDGDALGSLRRSDVVLTTRAAQSWTERWVSTRSGTSVVAGDLAGLVERAVAARSRHQTTSVVVADTDDVAEVSAALAPVRQVGAPRGPSIYDGAIIPSERLSDWIGGRPLLGWTVVVTRPAHQAPVLAESLAARGAQSLVFPAIRILPPTDSYALDRAASSIDDYDWILFTSANAVSAFREAMFRVGRDARNLAGCRVAVIGPGTARALGALGVKPDVIPDEFVAESLLEALRAQDRWEGRRVLLPRAAQARTVLPDGLSRWGANVDVVVAYRTVAETEHAAEVRRMLDEGLVDMVTFTASSAVRAFRGSIGDLGLASGVAIGPITAATAAEEGLELAEVADEFTTRGLVRACERVASRNRSSSARYVPPG